LEGGANITVGARITAFANNVEVMYMLWGVAQDLAPVAPFASGRLASIGVKLIALCCARADAR
jgi:hypothetical protein